MEAHGEPREQKREGVSWGFRLTLSSELPRLVSTNFLFGQIWFRLEGEHRRFNSELKLSLGCVRLRAS
jgi:hypothetical protein